MKFRGCVDREDYIRRGHRPIALRGRRRGKVKLNQKRIMWEARDKNNLCRRLVRLSSGEPIVFTSNSFNLICLSRSNLSPSSAYTLFQYAEQIVWSSAKRTKVSGWRTKCKKKKKKEEKEKEKVGKKKNGKDGFGSILLNKICCYV